MADTQVGSASFMVRMKLDELRRDISTAKKEVNDLTVSASRNPIKISILPDRMALQSFRRELDALCVPRTIKINVDTSAARQGLSSIGMGGISSGWQQQNRASSGQIARGFTSNISNGLLWNVAGAAMAASMVRQPAYVQSQSQAQTQAAAPTANSYETGVSANRLGNIQESVSGMPGIGSQMDEMLFYAEKSQKFQRHQYLTQLRILHHLRRGNAGSGLGVGGSSFGPDESEAELLRDIEAATASYGAERPKSEAATGTYGAERPKSNGIRIVYGSGETLDPIGETLDPIGKLNLKAKHTPYVPISTKLARRNVVTGTLEEPVASPAEIIEGSLAPKMLPPGRSPKLLEFRSPKLLPPGRRQAEPLSEDEIADVHRQTREDIFGEDGRRYMARTASQAQAAKLKSQYAAFLAGTPQGQAANPMNAFTAAIAQATQALHRLAGAAGGGGSGGQGGGGQGGDGGDGSMWSKMWNKIPKGMRGYIKSGAVAELVAAGAQAYSDYAQLQRDKSAFQNAGISNQLRLLAQTGNMAINAGSRVPLIGPIVNTITGPISHAIATARGVAPEDLNRLADEYDARVKWAGTMDAGHRNVSATLQSAATIRANSIGGIYGGAMGINTGYDQKEKSLNSDLRMVGLQFGTNSEQYAASKNLNQRQVSAAHGERNATMNALIKTTYEQNVRGAMGAGAALNAAGNAPVAQFQSIGGAYDVDIAKAQEQYKSLQDTAAANPSNENKMLAAQAGRQLANLQKSRLAAKTQMKMDQTIQFGGMDRSTAAMGKMTEGHVYAGGQMEIENSYLGQIMQNRGNSQAMGAIMRNMNAQKQVHAQQFGEMYYGSKMGTTAIETQAKASEMRYNRNYRGAEMLEATEGTKQQLGMLDPRQFTGGENGADFKARQAAIMAQGRASAKESIKNLEMPTPMSISGGITMGYTWHGTGDKVGKKFDDAMAGAGKTNMLSGGQANAPSTMDFTKKMDDTINNWSAVVDKWSALADQINKTTY